MQPALLSAPWRFVKSQLNAEQVNELVCAMRRYKSLKARILATTGAGEVFQQVAPARTLKPSPARRSLRFVASQDGSGRTIEEALRQLGEVREKLGSTLTLNWGVTFFGIALDDHWSFRG